MLTRVESAAEFAMSLSSRRFWAPILVLASCTLAQWSPAQQAIQPAANAPCNPEGDIRFVCGQRRPEDLVRVPHSDWVMASWLSGGVAAINVRDRTTRLMYPTPTVEEKFDKATYPDCPGALDEKQKEDYLTAGIAISPGKNGVHTFYATHFGWKRGIDVFKLDARGQVPSLTLVGCVDVPDGVGVDSLVPLPNNGFIITNWLKPGPTFKDELEKMKTGAINGELWEWHPGSGWNKVPGSETSGANGIEMSRDGKWLYVNAWGAQNFYRLSRDKDAKRETITLDFRPDNIRWAPDGNLLIAGQTASEDGTRLVKLDPKSLQVTDLVRYHDTKTWGFGTVAIQVGNDYWMGSATADRLAVFPVKK